MIIRHCPDCGNRMVYKSAPKLKRGELREGWLPYNTDYHHCNNCNTAVNFRTRNKWKEVDQNA